MTPKKEKLYTLVFVKNQKKDTQEVLLGFKKTGFDEGNWNGFGGKIERKESILKGALRELKEESGLSGKLRRIGVLHIDGRVEGTVLVIHVFDTYTYIGDIMESREMRPKWFNVEDIPFSKMNKDARMWFDLMLKGNFFKAYFHYKNNEIIDHKIEQLTDLKEI